MTFTVEDMDRRTRESLVQGELMGAEIVLECIEDVLAQMEIVERPKIMERLKDLITQEIEESVSTLGDADTSWT